MSPTQIPLGVYLLLLDLVLLLLPLRDQRGEHRGPKGGATCIWTLRDRVHAEVAQHRHEESFRKFRRRLLTMPTPEWLNRAPHRPDKHRLATPIDQLEIVGPDLPAPQAIVPLPRGIQIDCLHR